MGKRLPEGWEWKRLGDVVEILDSQRIPIKKDEREKRISDKSSSELIPYYGATGQVGWIDDYIFDEELVLLGEDGVPFFEPTKNKAYIITGKSWVNNHVHVLRAKKSVILNSFLYRYLNIFNYNGYVAGTTRLKLNKSRMSKIPIPRPPLETQRKIVAILEKADETKRLRMQADEFTSQLLQSVFLEMFGDPVKNPKRWEMVKLGDFGDWTSGGTPSRTKPEYFQGNIPWFTAGELNDSYLLNSKERITEEALEVSAAKIFPKETMLIGMYDSAAFKMGLLLQPASSNQACAAFIPKKEELDSLFALHLFKAMKPVFLSKRRGVRQKNLSQSIIKNFEVPLPPFSLQMEFRQIVETIEKMLQNQKQSQQEIDNLFNALMQKAFKGELVS